MNAAIFAREGRNRVHGWNGLFGSGREMGGITDDYWRSVDYEQGAFDTIQLD